MFTSHCRKEAKERRRVPSIYGRYLLLPESPELRSSRPYSTLKPTQENVGTRFQQERHFSLFDMH